MKMMILLLLLVYQKKKSAWPRVRLLKNILSNKNININNDQIPSTTNSNTNAVNSPNDTNVNTEPIDIIDTTELPVDKLELELIPTDSKNIKEKVKIEISPPSQPNIVNNIDNTNNIDINDTTSPAIIPGAAGNGKKDDEINNTGIVFGFQSSLEPPGFTSDFRATSGNRSESYESEGLLANIGGGSSINSTAL